MKFTRQWAMPSADTFSVKPIRKFVLEYLSGVVVDPFARNSDLATYRNDLDPTTAAESHLQAHEFLYELATDGVKADVVLLDPPYSPRQISECYKRCGLGVSGVDTQNARLYKRVKKAVRKLCKVGTYVLSFGWNSVGMGDGFEIVEILICCHGSAHNDTICLAERSVC